MPAEPTTTPTPVVVVEGDIVTFHMTCADADGKVGPRQTLHLPACACWRFTAAFQSVKALNTSKGVLIVSYVMCCSV